MEAVARDLRLAGNAAQALEVAASGRRSNVDLRMEEALAAFALGRDDIAAEIAASDGVVDLVVRPLVQAARGELPMELTGGPAPLRALRHAARAVAHAAQGDPARAWEELAAISRTHRKTVLAPELAAALDAFERSQGGLRARLAAARSPEAAVAVLRGVDPAIFPPSERPAALLYRGYGLLMGDTRDPVAAERCFDQAIAEGADLVEALRGKMLAAMDLVAPTPRGSPAEAAAIRKAAAAIDRVSRALAREPRARPLAITAALLAARAWRNAHDDRAAEASLAEARALGATDTDIAALNAPYTHAAEHPGEDEGADLPALVPASGPLVLSMARDILRELGVPPSALDWLPPTRRELVAREIVELVQHAPTPTRMARMAALVAEMGERPPRSFRAPPRPQPKLKRKQKQKKQKRKKR